MLSPVEALSLAAFFFSLLATTLTLLLAKQTSNEFTILNKRITLHIDSEPSLQPEEREEDLMGMALTQRSSPPTQEAVK